MVPPMPMRCDVERDQGGDDPFGGGQNFVTHLQSEPCSWWTQAGREVISNDRSAVVADEHLIVGRDVDIREGDRIVGIVDQLGRGVIDRVREVEYVAVERSHLDCSLRSVS